MSPKVDGKAFPYTKKGEAAAKAASKKSGKPMEVDKKKAAGKKMPPGMKGY